jgi:hypothetical protein
MANQEDLLSDSDLAALAKEWLSSLFQSDAGQPSASTYEPPTYPQYSPDPTEEELAMTMLDSDEQFMGPGVGNLLMLLPWMRAAKAAQAGSKALNLPGRLSDFMGPAGSAGSGGLKGLGGTKWMGKSSEFGHKAGSGGLLGGTNWMRKPVLGVKMNGSRKARDIDWDQVIKEMQEMFAESLRRNPPTKMK